MNEFQHTSEENGAKFQIQPLNENHRLGVKELLREEWGGTTVVSRGKIHDASRLPGFIARLDAKLVGLLTYRIDGASYELVTLNSLSPGIGVGSALVSALKVTASITGCRRLWLITTNDNTRALRFYQRQGFQLIALHFDAIEVSRKLKPEIPLVGYGGIAIRHELELEMAL